MATALLSVPDLRKNSVFNHSMSIPRTILCIIILCNQGGRSFRRTQKMPSILFVGAYLLIGNKNIIFARITKFAVRKRGSERTEREKALSRLRRPPQPGALTLRIPQDNSIFSSSRKRRMESLFSSPRTSCLDLFLIDHFPLLTSQDSARSGL